EHGSPAVKYPNFALEMALFADRLAQIRLEILGVHDRVGPCQAVALLFDVQLTRTVAALAPDAESVEHGGSVAIYCSGHGIGAVAVAKEALLWDGAFEVRVIRIVARRDGPALLFTEPAESRLKQVSAALEQKRAAVSPGADRILDLGLKRGQHAAV